MRLSGPISFSAIQLNKNNQVGKVVQSQPTKSVYFSGESEVQKPKVLIIDDEPLALDNFRTRLNEAGYDWSTYKPEEQLNPKDENLRVITTTDEVQALPKTGNLEWADIILLDNGFPSGISIGEEVLTLIEQKLGEEGLAKVIWTTPDPVPEEYELQIGGRISDKYAMEREEYKRFGQQMKEVLTVKAKPEVEQA